MVDLYVKEVFQAVVNVLEWMFQSISYGRTRVTFCGNEASMYFVLQIVNIKYEEIEVQPIESPVVVVKVL